MQSSSTLITEISKVPQGKTSVQNIRETLLPKIVKKIGQSLESFSNDTYQAMTIVDHTTWDHIGCFGVHTVCTFKKKIHSWLRSAETERKSTKGSLRSSESR